MKKFLAITALSVMSLLNTVSATPIDNGGQALSKEETRVVKILENIATSYIETEEILTEEGFSKYLDNYEANLAVVVSNEAIVREYPNQDSDIINYVKESSTVVVSERVDNYYKVEIDGMKGYVYKEQLDDKYLKDIPYIKTEVKAEPVPVEKTEYIGNQIVDYAKKHLGNPYVYGGNSLTKGVDCSGFTSQVFKHFGINLQRSSRAQFASNGRKVSKAEILPGDLVFYGHNGYIDHVAIYAGNGQIIHASTPKTGICMGKLEYGKPIIGIKRVV
ncbi:MAG: NlpC/P60 family protein [Cellulosilyticaceae bacterium]